MAVVVRVLAGAFEQVLGEEPCSVPAGPVVLSVAGTTSRDVLVDGQRRRLSRGEVGLLALDLTRSTGFHRVIVEGREFWFGTRDSKLGVEGLSEMLDELGTVGTGWTGQVMFSSGAGLRDPHVSYGWLDQRADQALRAIGAVLQAPRADSRTVRAFRRRGGSGVLLAPTLRLLRSDPSRYLAPSPRGLIHAGEERYEPLRVVAKKRQTTLLTVANRRAVAVLCWIETLARDVALASSDANAVARARLWRNAAQAMLLRPLPKAIGRVAIPGDGRQPEEVIDPPYRATFELAEDLKARFGWSASIDPTSRLSYVQYADEIYQAYVASRIARHLGMAQTSPVLGQSQPAFAGDRYEIYYDTSPPRDVLRSWRWHSDLPDSSRPDLLLVDRTSGFVAVMDAKYRLSRSGGATEDSRKEVSAYMALYGLDAVSIAYPGAGETAVVEGRGRRIFEMPVSPGVADLDAQVDALRSTLQPVRY